MATDTAAWTLRGQSLWRPTGRKVTDLSNGSDGGLQARGSWVSRWSLSPALLLNRIGRVTRAFGQFYLNSNVSRPVSGAVEVHGSPRFTLKSRPGRRHLLPATPALPSEHLSSCQSLFFGNFFPQALLLSSQLLTHLKRSWLGACPCDTEACAEK